MYMYSRAIEWYKLAVLLVDDDDDDVGGCDVS